MDKILHLVGLSHRAGKTAVGDEPVGAVARARDARLILVAGDAADNTLRRARHFAQAGQCLWLTVPYGKEELGRASGCSSCAMLAVTDVGLASAIVSALAQEDPQRYTQPAQRLQLKAKRAQERQEERRRHEKNLRQGKKRAAAPEAEARPEKAPAKRVPAAKRPSHPRQRKNAQPTRFLSSRPVKKGKGSFRKRDENG